VSAANADVEDHFGDSVAISGDTIVVGARNEDGDGSGPANNAAESAGAAYVFERSGMTWTQTAYLKASNAETSDVFGIQVAIDGDTIVFGAAGEDGNGSTPSDNSANSAGAAYVFVRSGATWVEQAYLKASNAEAQDVFGNSVALSGDRVAIGATLEAGNGSSPSNNSMRLRELGCPHGRRPRRTGLGERGRGHARARGLRHARQRGGLLPGDLSAGGRRRYDLRRRSALRGRNRAPLGNDHERIGLVRLAGTVRSGHLRPGPGHGGGHADLPVLVP